MPKKQSLMPMPKIIVKGGIPTLTVDDLKRYITLAKGILIHTKQDLANNHYNKHELYTTRTKINRLSRQLNNLRKRKSKPYQLKLKKFKHQIDEITKYTKDTGKLYTKKISIYNQQKQELLQSHWTVILNQVCNNRHVPTFPLPKDCLKLSLTNQQRLQLIVHQADLEVADQHRQATKPVGDKMVDTISHQVVGKAVQGNVQFHDSTQNYMRLIDFAHKNHIHIHFPHEQKYLQAIKQQQITQV